LINKGGFRFMRSRIQNLSRKHFSLFLKGTTALSLCLFGFLIVACGTNLNTNTTTTAQIPGNPLVTVTINPNQIFASPTPKQPAYTCGAWVTNTTPAYSRNGVVPVYALYKQNQDGNPVGMDGANATATVIWPFSAPETFTATTTSDGLAVFMVNMQASAIGHVVLISVGFTSNDGAHTCDITGSQDAFFTPIQGAPQPTPRPTGGGNPPTRPTPILPVLPPGGPIHRPG
jgi:hypothetical protein